MDIGAVGTWFFFEGMTAAESVDFAKKLEKFGYHTHWIPEALGREPFAHSGYLLANTERLILTTGIANIWARDPVTMAAATNTLADLSGGRFGPSPRGKQEVRGSGRFVELPKESI
jgi:alkanesulfonate monooxygenase SsuD/methylene tetrahydromethanopterin reductase-like flavin-dependent oxidoreductase (luciferase family)